MLKKLFFIITVSAFVFSCGGKKEGNVFKLSEAEETELLNKASSIFGVLPNKMPGSENDSPELIELGKKLYFETRLSVNNTMSCNTCHDINNMAGVDNKPTSPGALQGTMGTRTLLPFLMLGFNLLNFGMVVPPI